MADKKFTQKVGYQDSLEFDPINGIMKYGNYEAYASEMGVKPQSKKVTLDDYIASVQKSAQSGPMGIAASNMFMGQITEQQRKQYRPQFEAYMDSFFGGGNGRAIKNEPNTAFGGIGSINTNPNGQDLFGVGYSGTDIWGRLDDQNKEKNFSRVSAAKKLGADEYEIVTYDIAKDQDAGFGLLNQINNRAAQLSRVKVSNDALRQNQQDAANRRQGRAATVINS